SRFETLTPSQRLISKIPRLCYENKGKAEIKSTVRSKSITKKALTEKNEEPARDNSGFIDNQQREEEEQEFGKETISSVCPSTPLWNIDTPFLTGQFHQEVESTPGLAESKGNSVDLGLESEKPIGCYSASVQVYAILTPGHRTHQIDDALDCLNGMVDWGVHPNAITYNILIFSLCIIGDVFKAKALMKNMQTNGVKPDVLFFQCFDSELLYDEEGREGTQGPLDDVDFRFDSRSRDTLLLLLLLYFVVLNSMRTGQTSNMRKGESLGSLSAVPYKLRASSLPPIPKIENMLLDPPSNMKRLVDEIMIAFIQSIMITAPPSPFLPVSDQKIDDCA
ncbi:Pentatricopeptide repeat-containing protein, partial [Cynara cardunculus var. scolymus]